MYSQGQSLNTAPELLVETPNLPESMANPMPFFIEFGRNKMLGEKNVWTRNDYREVNWMNYQKVTADYIAENSGTGWGLYATAFQYDDIDIYAANMRGDFYLDFDNEDNIRLAQEDAYSVIRHLTISPNYKIPLNMIKVFFSGKKGIHVTVPYQCFGLNWHDNLHGVYRLMAEELKPFAPNGTLDMSVYERRRMFRLVRSQHASTGSFKVPMELKHLLSKTEQDIQQLSKDPNYGSHIRYEKPRVIKEAQAYIKYIENKSQQVFKSTFSKSGEESTLDFDPPCYQEMIDNGPVKGSRNIVACMLVVFWRQRGFTEQEAWDNLVDWNSGSLTQTELKTLFRSNFKGQYTYGCRRIKENANCPATCKADCKFFKPEQ